jgi:L-rhamnose isomerase / sugar isomerase
MSDNQNKAFDLLVETLGKKTVDRVTERVASLPIEVPSWGFGRGGTRFAGYRSDDVPHTVAGRIAAAGEFHRRTGKGSTVALHFPWDGTTVKEIRSLAGWLKKAAVKPGTINLNLFDMRSQGPLDARLRFGSLTNPLADVRKASVQHGIDCIKIMRRLKADTIVLWLPDGTNSPGQMSMFDQADRLDASCKAIYKALNKGEKMLIEYKLFEPGFYSTAIQDYARSRSLCRMLGSQAKVLVDLGHHAHGINVEQIIAHLVREGDLGGFHFNDSYYADDDLATGSLHPAQIFRIMCTLVEGEQRGYHKVNNVAFMIDQSHNVKEPLEEMVESTVNIETAYAKALLVDWKALKKAQDACDPSTADAILTDAFLTDVRPLLAMVRQG